LERQQGKYDAIMKLLQDVQEDSRGLIMRQSRCERALEIVKAVGLATQQQLEYHLSEQVSLAMESVFDDPYKLSIHFQEKRGKTEAELLFNRRNMEMPPIGSVGGGAIDVASFALRIAYFSMRQDKHIRPLLLLDEPFSQLKGEDANLRALAMVQELSKRLDIQIIMISDERIPREDIIANSDRVFCVTQSRKGISTVIDNTPKMLRRTV